MSNDPRILFLGGKNIGAGCLQFLLEDGYNVVGVVLNHRELSDTRRWYRSTADIACGAGVPVLSFQTINSPAAVDAVRALAPDIQACVFYDEIFRGEFLAIPSLGTLNMHMALAEEYRGRFPCNYAILNGESRTGVTLHYVDEGVDSGDIVADVEVAISQDDTAQSLYDRCTEAGIELFREHFPKVLDGTAKARPQEPKPGMRTYGRKDLPAKEIDFSLTGREIYDFVRALTFPPFEPPHFFIGDRKMVVVPEESVASDWYDY
jgi:methionyl-tRNA formyltransferase